MLNRKSSRGVSKIKVGAMLAIAVMGVTGLVPQVHAAPRTKADNTDPLNALTSWLGGVVPTAADTAVFNNSLAGTSGYSFSLGADTSWLGIQYLDPASGITISAGNTLSLGAGGIDMSAAATGSTLSILSGLALTSNQTFHTGDSSNKLIIGPAGTTVTLGSNTLNMAGLGASTFSGVIAGGTTGQFIMNSGLVNLRAANTFGTFTLNGGNVSYNNNGAFASQLLRLNGGSISNTSGANQTLSGLTQISLGGTIAIDNVTHAVGAAYTSFGAVSINLTGPTTINVLPPVLNLAADDTIHSAIIGGDIVGTDSITLNGPGGLTLMNANRTNFTGDWIINNGRLNLFGFGNWGGNPNGAVINLLGTGTVFVNAGGTLVISPSNFDNPNSYRIPNNIVLSGGDMVNPDSNPILSGTITATAGTASVIGPRWNNKAMRIEGPLVGTGTLVLARNRAGNAGNDTAQIIITTTDNTPTFMGTLLINSNPSSTPLSNSTVYGPAQLLIGTNLPTGGTITQFQLATIDTGLPLAAPAPTPLGFAMTNNNSTTTVVFGALTGAARLDMAVGGQTTRVVALVVGTNNQNATFGGSIRATAGGQGNQTVDKVGTGTWTIVGTNVSSSNYLGTMQIQNGVLVTNDTRAFGSSTAAIQLGDAAGVWNGSDPSSGTLSWTGGNITYSRGLLMAGNGAIANNHHRRVELEQHR